mmetsp:Transcript_24343/g.36301  ORF Transcript_24343/g.36301 Transcript_24343/m.36301 type:complete len:275 (+) Transcript_24343:138-962(+)
MKVTLFITACLIRSNHAFAPLHGLITNQVRGKQPLVSAPSIIIPPRHDATDSSPATTRLHSSVKGIELAGLLYDSTSMATEAWDWTANLGAPAALVAGAVIATLYETRENFAPKKNESKWVRIAKQSCRFLLLSSFALETLSIFVGTVTGNVLLGHGEQIAAKAIGYTSPLALLKHHHEINYLTIQICFLQGLFNWLGAVAIDLLIPKEGETKSARKMNQCMATTLVTISFWITAFYNYHLNFYDDYAQMHGNHSCNDIILDHSILQLSLEFLR